MDAPDRIADFDRGAADGQVSLGQDIEIGIGNAIDQATQDLVEVGLSRIQSCQGVA